MVKLILKWNKLTNVIEYDPKIQDLSNLRRLVYELTQVLPQNQKLITKNDIWSGTLKTEQDLFNAKLKDNQQILLMGNISTDLHQSGAILKKPHEQAYKISTQASNFISIFIIFLTLNSIAAIVNHIEDTDETYGYWEPLHFLLNGQGFQTWEYSPIYAIRTYAFILPFYIISHIVIAIHQMILSLLSYFPNFSLLFAPIVQSEFSLFFIIRFIIAIFTSYCETKYIIQIFHTLGYEIAFMTFIFLLASPGMFYLSTSYLPSSISTSLIMLTFTFWLQGTYSNNNNINASNINNNPITTTATSSNNTTTASNNNNKNNNNNNRISVSNYVWTIACGCITVLYTGWPFVGLIIVPLGIHMLLTTFNYNIKNISNVFKLTLYGVIVLLCLVIPTIAIDMYMYGKR